MWFAEPVGTVCYHQGKGEEGEGGDADAVLLGSHVGVHSPCVLVPYPCESVSWGRCSPYSLTTAPMCFLQCWLGASLLCLLLVAAAAPVWGNPLTTALGALAGSCSPFTVRACLAHSCTPCQKATVRDGFKSFAEIQSMSCPLSARWVTLS